MLNFLMNVEEYVDRTKAGSDLNAIEELQLFGLGYRFIDTSQHDIDRFPEEEKAEELQKENSGVIIPNVDRVSLKRIIDSLELKSNHEERLEDYMSKMTRVVNPQYN